MNTPWIIIGASSCIATEKELADFYGQTFPRLLSECNTDTRVIRIVGFEKTLTDGRRECFIGTESTPNTGVPDNLIRWELNENLLLIGGVARPLTWQWQKISANGRITGEFFLDHSSDLYRMTANACFFPKSSKNDQVLLTDYDPDWIEQYHRMANWLQHAFRPDTILRMEHYGSTAIPGMSAKPIIDILAEIPSFDAARQEIIPSLNNDHWEYWWYSDHMIFIHRDAFSGIRTHHLHLAPAGHRLWEGIAFRDYLRRHPEAAEKYMGLKRELSERFRDDREAYTNAKTAVVREITDQALRAQSD